MVEDKTKRIAGIIFLSIGFVLILFLFNEVTFLFSIISLPIVITLGVIFLYRGLSLQNRGIMLLITGALFIILSSLLFSNAIIYIFQKTTLLILNNLLWVLCFIIPGVYKFIKKVEFNENAIYLYSLAPQTIFWLLIYTIIITAITTEAPMTFMSLYWQYFVIALGISFLLSLIVIGLAKAGIVI